jgi:hypothetical protein
MYLYPELNIFKIMMFNGFKIKRLINCFFFNYIYTYSLIFKSR